MPSVRAILFNTYLYSLTAVMIAICLPTLFLTTKLTLKFVHTWARWILAGLRVIGGVTHEVRGCEYIPEDGALFAVKHQSMWETVALFSILKNPAIVQKKELSRIPLYGQFTEKAGMISIDRNARATALRKMVAACEQQLKDGRSVVIFPEGSRSAPGTKLGYKSGVAGLYSRLNIPCIPVALNSGLYWPRRSLRFQTGTIQIEFLPPIEPGLKRKTFMAELEHRIEDASQRLYKEGLSALGDKTIV